MHFMCWHESNSRKTYKKLINVSGVGDGSGEGNGTTWGGVNVHVQYKLLKH